MAQQMHLTWQGSISPTQSLFSLTNYLACIHARKSGS